MNDAKFQERYNKIYYVFKDLPPELLSRYAITGHMTRQEAIKGIRLLNKSDLFLIIDKLPDKFIVKCIKNYLRQKAGHLKGKTIIDQIDSSWDKIIQKAG